MRSVVREGFLISVVAWIPQILDWGHLEASLGSISQIECVPVLLRMVLGETLGWHFTDLGRAELPPGIPGKCSRFRSHRRRLTYGTCNKFFQQIRFAPNLRDRMPRQLPKIIRAKPARTQSAGPNATAPSEDHSSKYDSHSICGIEPYDTPKHHPSKHPSTKNLRESASLSATICEKPFLSLRNPRETLSHPPASNIQPRKK